MKKFKGLEKWWLKNSSRQYLFEYNKAFAERIPPHALVLDAGSGTAPYRDLFKHARYENCDFQKVDKCYAQSTYVCDITDIPVEESRFDFVICNQVLEHLPNPQDALVELARVLKPGGNILCSAPLFYAEHEQPYDFFRYTQFGQQLLFERAGFKNISIERMEGYFGTIGYQLELCFRTLPIRPSKLGGGMLGLALAPFCLATRIASFLAAGAFYRLDRAVKVTAGGMAKNYVVTA